MDNFISILLAASNNPFVRLVLIAIVADTVFGILRAIKEHRFNSNFGIDGAIRKCAMVAAILFLVFVDFIIHVNLIGFVPETVRTALHIEKIGMMEFFSLLFLSYEAVSIVKNMSLCGLPVKKVWLYLRSFLGKYTDELPDTDELEDKPEANTTVPESVAIESKN